ncbi:MAG TPA: DNA repair ATPase [Thermoanaerobaculia bacterium]
MIEQGTYELLKARLAEQGKGLAALAETLNGRRLEIFGGTEMALLGSERIRTENNCVPRDIVEVGDLLLFGYNVFIGLKTETSVNDVLSLHRLHDFSPVPDDAPENFLQDAAFARDFHELYHYYKNSRLVQLRRMDAKLLAVFQTGEAATDIRVFRWAVGNDGRVKYIDNRGERDHVFPARYDFEWVQTTRADHVYGKHPHVSIADEVFVETVQGDLTIKIENNTETGLGILREAVDDPDQSLDDGQVHYALVGSLILLRILPYREKQPRHFVFNRRTKSVVRIDAIGAACVQLPEDHGIVFPGGYYLRTGESRLFDHDPEQMEMLRIVRSPNGEDVLYVFHRRDEGRTLLLPYNLIRKDVVNPLPCNGYSIFPDGRMVIFQATGSEPTRVHAMQIWQTPFLSDDYASRRTGSGTYLEKIGNRDLVRGISDVLTICRLVDEQTPTRATYEDVVAATGRAIDAYYWLGHEEAGGLLPAIRELRATGELVIDEFEKVESLRARAEQAVAETETAVRELFARTDPSAWHSVDEFVASLGELRSKQGQVISLRELRYVDLERLTALEAEIVARFDDVSRRTVAHLLDDAALASFADRTATIESRVESVQKTTEAAALVADVEAVVGSLNLLAEVVSSLEIEDPTIRIRILEQISTLMAGLNRVRALVMQRRQQLAGHEQRAEFGVQYALLGQSVANAVSVADTPDRCDAELSKLMLHVEDLESRFSDLDEFVEQLTARREEIYEALTAKKQTLLEQQQRRAGQLAEAATRILQGIRRRAESLGETDALNAFFASDAMVAKLRSTANKLRELGDIVRADEIDGRLKIVREEAARGLRDRRDIFEEGSNIIRFGEHRFSVNNQAIELTVVPREGRPHLHVSGTGFFEPIDDPAFESARSFWDQELVSETRDVYRAEYLAYQFVCGTAGTLPVVTQQLVAELAASRYDEGYERGVHDSDATLIAEKLRAMLSTAGVLRFTPSARAAATMFWAFFEDESLKQAWTRQAQSLRRLREATPPAGSGSLVLATELQSAIDAWLPVACGDISGAGEYLFEEIAQEPVRFVISAQASSILEAFNAYLRTHGHDRAFGDDIASLDLPRRYATAQSWVESFVASRQELEPQTIEAVAAIVTNALVSREQASALVETSVTGLLGQHPRIVNGALQLQLDEFLQRLSRFESERVTGFRAWQQTRHAFLERERRRLRIEELQAKVMSAFVRNKLISEVYLPLIGSNLAKQIGVAGDKRRTDQMGLLLLVSPPGYGKTTLMEYVADRLGLVFVKINGPALGHAVRSLDPAEAPNATSRQEIVKLNLALELAENVLLYVDDIQHTHAEFLQKFISLCDAQRKIEGVWRGETRTYDLRGKRFAVCMAGNPYTESGETFEIPDMLANRADVYNLGEVLQGKEDLFELSYIENALTSNPVTAPLLTREPEDVHKLVRMARGEAVQADQLAHDYSSVELNEILDVMRKLVTVQRLLSRVNRQYVLSAAQQNAYRTEPPFKLQGSYRNMSKLAEKIVPAMNDDELQRLLDDHYLGEAQTLTTGAEENLLKLAEIRGRMTEAQHARWSDIKQGFVRQQRLGGGEGDPASRVMAELSVVSDKIGEVAKAIGEVTLGGLPAPSPAIAASDGPANDLAPYLQKLDETLLALRELHTARLPIAVQTEPTATPDPNLISREQYLITGTLIPLLRFMAHRFRSYRSISDPRVKQAISRLEKVHDLTELVATLESISVSALATLTESAARPKSDGTPPQG